MPKSPRRDQDEQAAHINFFFFSMKSHKMKPLSDPRRWFDSRVFFFFFFNYRRRAPSCSRLRQSGERRGWLKLQMPTPTPSLLSDTTLALAALLLPLGGGGQTFPLVGPQWLLNCDRGTQELLKRMGADGKKIQYNNKRELWLEIQDKNQMRPKKTLKTLTIKKKDNKTKCRELLHDAVC